MSTDLSHDAQVNPLNSDGAAVVNQAKVSLLPTPKELWRNIYDVIDALPDKGGAQWWSAQRKDTAETVLLCARPEAKNDPRSTAWGHLRKIELSHLQRVQEEFSVGGYRVEVYASVQGTPLDAWRRERAAPEVAIVEALVRQLTEAIGVLHASGLVHLGISPSAIFIQETKGQLNCILGALETVALIDHNQPILFRPDPFYAPPEVVMLESHDPSPALCAWDWWSLGRVVQELILGHPVMDDLPEANPAETSPQRVDRAESLLLELAPGGSRAGAVEAMPPMDARLQLLLRGLLSSAPEVRWGMEAMDSWGRQLPVKENYDTRRTETKFRWRGRRYSIPNAAMALQMAEDAEEAVANIFDGETPGTLIGFIGKVADPKNYAPQLKELLQLVEVEPLRALPVPLAREVVTSLALLTLAGQNFVWRRQRFGGECLPALLAEAPDSPDQYALVRALTHRTVTAKIERYDHAAGRSLTQIGRLAEDSESLIRRNGWLKGEENTASEKIFRLAITADSELLALRERLRHDFACTTHASLQRSFQAAKPTRVDLVLIAWIEPKAAENGFLTHAEWEARQLVLLKERSVPLVAGLFWTQQAKAREAGLVVFGQLPAVFAIWGGAAAVLALLSPGPMWIPAALLPGAVALGIRAFFSKITAAELRRFIPQARPWKWADNGDRCQAEMAAVTKGIDRAGLERALDAVDDEIAKLKLLVPPPSSISRPPRFYDMRMAGFASWVLVMGVVLCATWRGYVAPPSWPNLQTAWLPSQVFHSSDSGSATGATAGITGRTESDTATHPTATLSPEAKAAARNDSKLNALPADAAAAKGLLSKATESTANGVSGSASTLSSGVTSASVNRPKVDWPFPLTSNVSRLSSTQTLEASPAQIAYAIQHGRSILAPYKAETTQLRVIFEVPLMDQIGVMIFDGSRDALVAPTVFILDKHPPQQSWIELDLIKGFVVAE